MLSQLEREVLKRTALHSALAAPLCQWLTKTTTPFSEQDACRAEGISSSQQVLIINVLKEFAALGIVRERSDYQWERITNPEMLGRLATIFEAVAYYREQIHQDATTASVVLTRPPQPSRLEIALNDLGWQTTQCEITTEAFGYLAASAKESLTIVTPFLDVHGARWLAGLLSNTGTGVRRQVILRYVSDPSHPRYPAGYPEFVRMLDESGGAQVFDYALPRNKGEGLETFHAKVIVADNDQAYVGSANLNRPSLEYSMELGVLLRGEAAKKVARIVMAILEIAQPVKLY